MANEKTIKTRIQLKNDIQTNWDRQVNFIPLKGEVIIYSADDSHPFSRLKIGDGEKTVPALPFIDSGTINGKILEDSIIIIKDGQFPSIGQENKLYVNLNNNTIYCYKPYSGFSQLSHFKYTPTTTRILTINDWNPGTMTSISVNSNSLIINNGTEPVLDLNTLNVVTDIEEVNNNA